MLRGMKVLVTGGAGFIGSWLCETLVDMGAYVTCLDNLSTGRIENIEHLLGKDNFSFLRADITEKMPRWLRLHSTWSKHTSAG